MANIISDKYKKIDPIGRRFPLLKGDVKVELKNVHNGKTEVIEDHNMITNALADMFEGNYGGLLNYNSFADLYNTWLGGVLVFANALDISDADAYGIPARTSNACTAHAGQTPLTDQADDLTRGNPDNAGTVLTSSSTKMCWEWGTSAGNGAISALGLTHSDVGSYGCGVVSTAQGSLTPFVNLGCLSQSYAFGDNANCPLAMDDNFAYSFYLSNSTTVHIYKTPINNSEFKLQGGSLSPLSAYTQVINANLPNSYEIGSAGSCYFWFDFANDKLVLFGVPSAMGETLYRDDISLTDGTVTHNSITVTGAKLWKFRTKESTWDQSYGAYFIAVPTPAIILDGYLYVYACSTYANVADKMFKINLSNTAQITEIDTSDFGTTFTASAWSDNWTMTTGKTMTMGGLIVNDSYIVNGDKVFNIATSTTARDTTKMYADPHRISSAVFGCNRTENNITATKLYLATKYNLPSTVNKNSSQSLRIEYTLQEV